MAKRKTSLACKAFIQKHIPLELAAVKVNGIWVIGYGHIGKDVKPNMKITPVEAMQLLLEDINKVEKIINRLVKVNLTQGQYDALVSFTFSMGSGALKSSVLLKELNLGHYDVAAGEFRRWCFDGIRRDPTLVKRREEERKAFLDGFKN